jgi:hypothetical protein
MAMPQTNPNLQANQQWMHKIATGQDTGGVLGGLNPVDWLMRRPTAPSMDQSPYRDDYDSLIGQLQSQSAGNGPSLAGNAYAQAHAAGKRGVLAMSRGGSPGAARAGMQQMGMMNQGLSAGYANARLQEQMMARQALIQALQGGQNAWFQPQQANLSATMGTPTNGQMLTGFIGQLAPSLAQVWGNKKPQGA